jgi:hypothetical protein
MSMGRPESVEPLSWPCCEYGSGRGSDQEMCDGIIREKEVGGITWENVGNKHICIPEDLPVEPTFRQAEEEQIWHVEYQARRVDWRRSD